MEDVNKGEVGVQKLELCFFKYLIAGPDARSWNQSSIQRKINSISQDVVFAGTSGVKKPRKHLMVGLALKSLTGRKNVIDMLNKLGHCASNHEEIETETTFNTSKNTNCTPYGMYLCP